MKLLFYSWNANNEQILADSLTKEGFEVVWFTRECRNYTRDMELAMEMVPYIHKEAVEAVISFNYFPIISMICNTCQIPYYAWVFDCPHFTLYARLITLPCNHIGIFDRAMVESLRSYGVETVYHAPLAVDTEYFDTQIRRASVVKRREYACDVSFVGSLYTGEYDYYDVLIKNGTGVKDSMEERETEAGREDVLGVEDLKEITDVMKQMLFKYNVEDNVEFRNRLIEDDMINLDLIGQKMKEAGLLLGEDYFAKKEDIFIPAVLEKKMTVEERRIILTKIAEKEKIKFKLYTSSDASKLPRLHACACGSVDYHTEMPLVFAGSKINLNITLRSIHSGIPLRVLDIMACGGFVLTNWQTEIAESFVEGKEIVTYSSLEECLAKVEYYLAHEEERRQIASAGRKKVREMFSYPKGLGKLFGI